MGVDKKKSITREIASQGHLDFLESMRDAGIELSPEQIQDLVRGGRLTFQDNDLERASADDTLIDQEYDLGIDEYSSGSREHDSRVLIMDDDQSASEIIGGVHKKVIRLGEESYDKLQETDLFRIKFEGSIRKEHWMPESLVEHTDDFILWINSINSGFQRMVKFNRFRMYCQQASNWLKDPRNLSDCEGHDERREYYIQEADRCAENTLYFMDKYVMIKEQDVTSSTMKYLSKPAHKVMCYLMDCKYSMMVGKGRQMAASTTFGGIALAKIIFNKNFFLKFIAQDDEKGKEIFTAKIKYPFGELPNFLKPSVGNDPENMLRFIRKTDKKGTKGGANSSIQVVAPKVDAVNGGAPDCVFIDEAGYIGMLGKMLKEARPTMFKYNTETGKLELKRQVVIWGTGGTEEGEVKRKTKAYETEFYNCMKQWENRNYKYGIIPLFFDWTARPGMTKKFYLQEKKSYENDSDAATRETSMIQFRQHYPSSPQDMFLSTGKLLVDALWIHKQIDKVREASSHFGTKKGYFEPIFDTSKPTTENSDVPYEIIGATFVPVDDALVDKSLVSVEIFLDPDKSWRNRYFQGTDPIMTDNGFSNMASSIYDAHFNTVAAVVNYRANDHKYTFLQTLLLGIYYHHEQKQAVPELVESNIGLAYINYKEDKGYGRSLVYRKELPDSFSGGSADVGIDNKGPRSRYIINKMIELTTAFGEKIYIMDYFKQLETFTCTLTAKGTEMWGVSDHRQFKDDVLYSSAFAYICKEAHDYKKPYQINSESVSYTVEYKLVRRNDGSLGREAVRKPIYH